MRVLVTGPLNPVGRALVAGLSAAGHQVRAFGVPAGENPFAGLANVECYPGDVALGGSIEPVACECQAIVHGSNLDAPGKDPKAHAVKVERGTLYTKYAAERELVGAFIHVAPWSPGARHSAALRQAEAHVDAARVPHNTVRADPANPQPAVEQVLRWVSGVQPIQHQGTASPADKPVASPTP